MLTGACQALGQDLLKPFPNFALLAVPEYDENMGRMVATVAFEDVGLQVFQPLFDIRVVANFGEVLWIAVG